MKKIFVLIAIAFISISGVNAQDMQKKDFENKTFEQQKVQEERIQRAQAFEKKLGLTEAQKEQARNIRFKGHMELGPVIQEIKLKKQEERMVKMSRIAVVDQEKKLAKIDLELKALEKKAQDVRKKNMKEFESILTKKQRKILKDMKKEGRMRYHQEHPMKKEK